MLVFCSFEIITATFFADFSGSVGGFSKNLSKVILRPIFKCEPATNEPSLCGHFSYQKFGPNSFGLLAAFFEEKKRMKIDKETKA